MVTLLNLFQHRNSDYMTGEIFSDDPTTLDDVLGNEYLMVHETAEISELKKMGRQIDKRVIVGSPKTVIYDAHFTAMELELDYALFKKDYFWVKIRLTAQRICLGRRPKPSRDAQTPWRGNIREIQQTAESIKNITNIDGIQKHQRIPFFIASSLSNTWQ